MTLDAHVFVGSLAPTGIHYADSLTLLTRIRAEWIEVVCPLLVLPECAGAVMRPTTRKSLAQRALTSVQILPGIRLVPLTDDRARRAADIAISCRLRGAAAVAVLTPTDWLAANPI